MGFDAGLVAYVVVDVFLDVAVSGEVCGLDADVDVALAEAKKAFTAFVQDFNLDLVQIAAELVERHLNGFLA